MGFILFHYNNWVKLVLEILNHLHSITNSHQHLLYFGFELAIHSNSHQT